MDNLSDPTLKLKYNKSKLKVKRWESQFRSKTGSNPTKEDIKNASCEIRDAYKWYWQIKIHALGQDSFLDATFLEQGRNDYPSSESFLIHEDTTSVPVAARCVEKQIQSSGGEETKQSGCEEEQIQSSGIEKIKQSGCVEEQIQSSGVEETKQSGSLEEKIQSLTSSSSNSLMDLTLSSFIPDADPVDPAVKEEETQQKHPIPSNIWGRHLDKHKNLDVLSEKKILNRSSSFQLSEKLFVGAKLKKRNPRKSLSFSVGRLKGKGSFASSDSLHVPSDSSFSVDNSQGLEDGFPVSVLENKNNDESQDFSHSSEFVMIKNSIVSNIQPISAVHRMMEGNVKQTTLKAERVLDRGWLDRVMQAESMVSKDVVKSPTLSYQEHRESEKLEGDIPKPFEDSDDDFIYGSDNEIKSPSKAEKEEKTRLALRSTVNIGAAVKVVSQDVVSGFEEVKGTKNSNVDGKKRKLDAIEAAMTILKEKRKSDVRLTQPNKKHKNECNSQEKHSNNESDVDENKKSSKSTLSKLEVLDKKIASGSINDNFVRINIKKKVFVRGKKTMNFQKYKKKQWKNRKKELSEEASAFISRRDPTDSAAGGGLQKCFSCGDVGHFAQKCLKMKGDTLMPNEEEEDDESPFPSLADVEKMAKEKRGVVHLRSRSQVKLESTSTIEGNKETNCSSKKETEPQTESQDTGGGDTVNSDVHVEDDSDITSILKEPVHESEIRFSSVEPLYALNEDGSVIDTPAEVYECLHNFGHKSFRPGQETAVMRILSGLPTLVTLSTGSGKSLCYQLPAYLYARKRNCITLVISPLVSLMDDQISGLPSFIQGAALHTGQTEKQREKVMDMVKSGKLQFLLVSPEAIVAGERKSGFGSLLRSLPSIAFACIDEAHCVSQWSHNFRPSYLVLFKVLREKLGVHTVLGLTATATQRTVKSIIEHIEIPDGYHGVIQDTPLPNNLQLTVSRDSHRDQALLKLLGSSEFENYKSVIVYCTRREECERLAVLLRTCLRNPSQHSEKKISETAEAYHAGLSSTRRKQVQTAFMSGKVRIVVATVAFGMGINKADIRSVIHFNLPRNFESYVQEVGRAGRDGEISHCHLFLNSEGKDMNELRRHIFADSVDRHTIRKLLQRVFIPCKCGKNDSSQEPSTSSEGERKSDLIPHHEEILSACSGHEVAFSVEATVSALDLPEENITTLLCYLELKDKKLLEVLPKAYTHCKVQSYKGMKHIRDAARSCPPLAMAVAADLLLGNSVKANHCVEFAVVDIASAIGWDSGIVKRELKNLEWTEVNGKSRRSGIKVEFSDLGFRVKAPGNLSPEKLDAALDFLYERVSTQEKSALCQLQAIFSAVTSVSFCNVLTMLKSSEVEENSNKLKGMVRAYFQEERDMTVTFKSEEKLENGDQIANDTRQLVSMYRDCSFTGRAVARIFHGISSPNFPAQNWGRCRFWRAHLESDFKLIVLLATRVLLKMR